MPNLDPLVLPEVHRVLILLLLVVIVRHKHHIIIADSEEIILALGEDLLRICSDKFPAGLFEVGAEVVALVFMLGGLLLLKLMMLEVVMNVGVRIGVFLFLRRGISDFLFFSLLSAHLGLGHSVLSQGAINALYNLDLICELDPIVAALDPRGLWLGNIDIIRTCATINAEFLHKHGFLDVWDHIGRLYKRKGERGPSEEESRCLGDVQFYLREV
jgi:hypothetical protein